MEQQLIQQRNRRRIYENWSLDQLKIYAKKHGVSYSGRTKGGIIDSLLATTVEDISLDPDQISIVSQIDCSWMAISAGPGTGKTTTLCALAANILYHRPQARICILVFNRAAERVCKNRCRHFGITPISVERITDPIPGCFVLTFDKYGYYARGRQIRSYRVSLEQAVERGPENHECWDTLIIDESQDLKPIHTILIKQLQPIVKHLILAGDPRQELYTGAVWFSQLWTESPPGLTKATLRYNHRSTPEIVQFLNEYSRTHFPTLHHDQIPTRSSGSPVSFEMVSQNQLGSHIASILLQSEPSFAYAISPVTVKKFNSEVVINSIRQSIYDSQPERHLVVLNDNLDNDITSGSYFIGNSFRLKGTERSSVIVFLADVPYEDYGISRTNSIKLIFVALSRARDHLHILLTQPSVKGSLWDGLVPSHIPISETRTESPKLPLFHLKVKEDLVHLEIWDPPQLEVTSRFVPINVPIIGDPDFVGIFVESSLASHLGCQLKKISSLRLARVQNGRCVESTGVFDSPDGYRIVLDGRSNPSLSDRIEQFRKADLLPEYLFSVIKMSSSIGRLWTLSEHLQSFQIPPEQLEPIGTYISGYLKRINHSVRCRLPIFAHRSNIQVGELHGEIDFFGQGIVEIKHATIDRLTQHSIQLAIYGAIVGFDSGLLINTKEGKSWKVKSFSKNQVSNTVRAFLALRQGTTVSARTRIRLPLNLKCDIAISVDVETVMISGKTFLTEIGAVAFQIGSDRIVSLFHQLNDGVTYDPLDMTGLRVDDINEVLDCHPLMVLSFKIWYTSLSQKRIFLNWAGSDLDILEAKIEQSLDVYRLYCIWLEKISQPRDQNRTLSDAVSHVLGPHFPFVAHRAFEDASVTGAVFIAITSHEGTL